MVKYCTIFGVGRHSVDVTHGGTVDNCELTYGLRSGAAPAARIGITAAPQAVDTPNRETIVLGFISSTGGETCSAGVSC